MTLRTFAVWAAIGSVLGLGLAGITEAQIVPGGSCNPNLACNPKSVTTTGAVTAGSVTTTGAVNAGSLNVTGANSFGVGRLYLSDAGANYLTSNSSNANVTSSVGAWTLKADNAVSANDLIVNVENSAGTNLCTIDAEGDLTCTGSITGSGGALSLGSGELVLTDAGVNYLKSNTSATNASSTAAPWTLAPTVVLDANDLVLNVENSAGTNLCTVDAEGDVVAAGGISGTSVSASGAVTAGNLVVTGAAQIDGGVQTTSVSSSGTITANSTFGCASTAGSCFISSPYVAGSFGGNTIVQPTAPLTTPITSVFEVRNQDAGILIDNRFDGINTFNGYRIGGDDAAGLVLAAKPSTAGTTGSMSVTWSVPADATKGYQIGMAVSASDFVTGSAAGDFVIVTSGSTDRAIVFSTAGDDVDFEFQTDGDFIADGTVTGSNLSGTHSGTSSGTNSGDTSAGSYGSSPNANGLSIASQVITLQPASVSAPGGVIVGAQTLGTGLKTMGSTITTTTVTAGTAVVLNSTATAKPSCTSGIRGSIWYGPAAGGAPDTIEICAKPTTDVYAWFALAVIP